MSDRKVMYIASICMAIIASAVIGAYTVSQTALLAFGPHSMSILGALGVIGGGAAIGVVLAIATFVGAFAVNRLFKSLFPGLSRDTVDTFTDNALIYAGIAAGLSLPLGLLFALLLMPAMPALAMPAFALVCSIAFVGTLMLANLGMTAYGFSNGMHHAPIKQVDESLVSESPTETPSPTVESVAPYQSRGLRLFNVVCENIPNLSVSTPSQISTSR